MAEWRRSVGLRLRTSGYIDEMPALVAARYRLGAPVGRGGMGRVWRAHDQILDRDVAVKEIIPPPGLSDPEAVHRRTLREARATARLSHPGVVRVFDVLEVDGGTWIVMEYVPSRSLQEVLAAEGPLPPRRVAKIGLDLLDALVAANRAGVEHRDVKPANVLLADDGRVMLTDFGIAAIADDPSNSMSDALIGSPEYMPPERTKNEHEGLASDLWSLGATLYAAVEGQSPFHRPTVAATLTAITISPPDRPVQAGPLTPVLTALLEKDPADRPSAADAARMLRSAASGAYGRASIPASDVRDGTAATEDPAVGDSSTPDGPPEPPATLPSSGSEKPAPLLSSGSEKPAPLLSGRREKRAALLSSRRGTRPPVAEPVPDIDGEAPAAAAASRFGRKWAAVAAAVLSLLLAAGIALWFVTRPSAHRQADPAPSRPQASAPAGGAAPGASSGLASGGPSSSVSASSSPSPAKSASSASGRPALPSGWHDYHDKTGFSVYVPNGWVRSQKGTMAYFRGDGRVLGVDQSAHPKSDPLADWRAKSAYRVSQGDFPGYHLIRLVAVDYLKKSADWEYTFDGSGTRQHVDNRNILASSHQAYAIYWQTSDAQWAAHQDDLALIYASFRPA